MSDTRRSTGCASRPTSGRLRVALAALLVCAGAARAGVVDPGLALRAERSQALGPRPIGVIVELDARPDLAAVAARLAARPPEERPGALAAELKAGFERVAPRVRGALERLGAVQIEPLWLSHAFAAHLAPRNIQELASVPGVARIYADTQLKAPFRPGVPVSPAALRRRLSKQVEKPVVVPADLAAPFDVRAWRDELPTHLAALGVAPLWQRGVSGSGVVVAVVDSGVNGRDATVMARFRGGPGDWFDPYGEHARPHDSGGHGTSVAYLLTGRVPTGKGPAAPVGVAPNARWIAARIYDDSGLGRLSAVHRIHQWLLDPDGQPGTNDAPRIVNNSWGLPQTVGRCDLEFARDFAALRAAGIHVVFAAGNEGPGADTSMSPANNPGVFAVGALGPDGKAIDQSSRGPSACGGGAYPHALAPGVDIESADPAGRVMGQPLRVTGTSFAAALGSGMLALLASESPAAPLEQRERALIAALASAPAAAPLQAATAAVLWRPTLAADGTVDVDAGALARVLPWTARLQRVEVEASPARGRLDTLAADRLRYSADASASAPAPGASPFALLAHTSDGRRWRVEVEPHAEAAVATGVPSRRLSLSVQGGQPAHIPRGRLSEGIEGAVLHVHASQTTRGGQVDVFDDGSVQYTPRTGFRGTDTFVCTLLNPEGAARGRVQVAVTVR